jgi:hypothetical protein
MPPFVRPMNVMESRLPVEPPSNRRAQLKLSRFVKRYLKPSRYLTNSSLDPRSVRVVEFRKLRVVDPCDLQYEAWSRIYEYPLLLNRIDQYAKRQDIEVHNSSWGFNSLHARFKQELERRYRSVVNTDILPSSEPNTALMDITKPPPQPYRDRFDVVLNVSTVEEVDDDHLMIVENLVMQVRPGGFLMITFDIPGMQMGKIEKFLGRTIERFGDELNGANSSLPNEKYAALSCGLLVLQKN